MKEQFEEFWSAIPKRHRSHPKEETHRAFLKAVANGADPQKIIGAARAWAKQEAENGKAGTEFVPMASTWLNKKRFNDFEPAPAQNIARWDAIASKHGYFWDPQANNGQGSYVKGEQYGQATTVH